MEKLREFLEDYWKIICILLIVIIVICFIFLRKSKKNKDEEATTPASSSGYSEDMVDMGEDDRNGDYWSIPEKDLQTEPEDVWTIPENELNN